MSFWTMGQLEWVIIGCTFCLVYSLHRVEKAIQGIHETIFDDFYEREKARAEKAQWDRDFQDHAAKK
jgi:hypothetical protein